MLKHMKQVKNAIRQTRKASWQELKTYEFNELKDKFRDISKLKNNILNNNFSFPFFVWADHKYVIDGTGRYLALLELEKEGYSIPDLDIVEIEAKSKKQAKKLVLSVSSSYGQISQASLADFTSLDFELEELEELANSELELSSLDYMLEQNLDYSILDDNKELDKQLQKMSGEVKKSIQIEFTPEDYEVAYELCRFARSKQIYIGQYLIGVLKDVKSNYEKN